LIIEKEGKGKIKYVEINGKIMKTYFISHQELVNSNILKVKLN